MKKTLAFMVMALALLLTQCKKPSIKFPTPSVTTTVSMTITAGPGSKTDITTEGGIVWSENDKIYVGNGSEYVGCLTLVSGVGNATGTFTGDVTATTGTNKTFHFYYLGNAKDYSTDLASHNTSVEVDFSSQDIYADGDKLKNASGQHVGYGKVEGVDVEADKPITGLHVNMKSKVAIAYFCFQDGERANPYKGALTLSGDHIYNKMTVKFDASDFDFTPVKDGNISLTNTTTHLKYAMLVPTGSTAEEILNFGGGATGATALENGIEANKFYRIDGSMPIVVTVKPIEFSVGSGTTVTFSPGNLQYLGQAEKGHKWRFAEHQWDYMGDGPNTTTGKKGNVNLGADYEGKYNTGSEKPGGSETEADSVAARDLFCWGATGFQDTRSHAYQKNYKPYSTSITAASGTAATYNKYGYGPDYDGNEYGLTVEAKSDWGCVPGLPSAGDGKTWRTLSGAEWAYLLNTRSGQFAPEIGSSTDCRYAEVKVNGVSGMMIFPDEFAWPSSVKEMPKTYNTYSSDYNGVNYGVGAGSDFEALEGAGVVFLPAAGGRYGTILGDGTYGGYWSSSCSSSSDAYRMGFTLGYVDSQRINTRCNGFSVRLVR